MIVDDSNDLLALLVFVPREPNAIALFLATVAGPVAMEHAQIEVLLGREMPHTGHKRPPQRPIIGPFGKDFVDGRVVDGRFPKVESVGTDRHFHCIPV